MALQLSFTSEFGSTHASAYAKVVGAWVDLVNNTIDVQILIWTSAGAKNASSNRIFEESVRLTITPANLGATPGVAVYTNLKH